MQFHQLREKAEYKRTNAAILKLKTHKYIGDSDMKNRLAIYQWNKNILQMSNLV